jgi:sphinganine-1-phosphate aldolase
MEFPKRGMSKDEVLGALRGRQGGDADWRHGRTFSLVYYAGPEALDLIYEATRAYFSENALNPMAFPGLRQCETDVVAMTAAMLSHPEAAGTMTTGGTESILMAVKTAREWARATRPEVTHPEMLVPITVHPAFEKAAHYFDVKAVHVPIGDDYRADIHAARSLINDNTILVVGSAPQYPHGVVDPIAELAQLAQQRGILCHVDACLGGFLLPWVEKLGYHVPLFDFRVPGVTSMSADVHKYGYAAKGASVVLYRDRDLRRYQFVAYADWPGGLYGSPSMCGTRAGGPIAAAWAIMNHLGEEGYLRVTQESMTTARRLMEGINAITGLFVFGDPVGSVFGFGSDEMDVYALSEAMEAKGWHLDRLQRPPGLHMMITPAHAPLVDQILADLAECAELIRLNGTTAEGAAAMYGALGTMDDRVAVNDFILGFLDNIDAR